MKFKRATIRDVSMHAGASIASVSRVVSGKGLVSPDLSLRIRKSVTALGYTPHAYAQALGRGSSNTILVVSLVDSDAIGGPILHALAREIDKRGYVSSIKVEYLSFTVTEANEKYFINQGDEINKILISHEKLPYKIIERSVIIILDSTDDDQIVEVAVTSINHAISSPSILTRIVIQDR